MNHLLKTTLAAAALLASVHAFALTRITFDAGDPIGGLSAGATLSNQYAAFGVTFAANGFTGMGGPTSDWASNSDMTIASTTDDDVGVLGGPSLVSGNLLHSLYGWADEDGDPSFRATFAGGITSFSADFAGVSVPGSVRLFAYNGSVLLGSVAGAGAGGGTTSQFTLAIAAARITSVVVTPGDYSDWVGVDNITFSPVAVAAVPEPESYALLGIGLVAVVVAAARRRGATAGV